MFHSIDGMLFAIWLSMKQLVLLRGLLFWQTTNATVRSAYPISKLGQTNPPKY